MLAIEEIDLVAQLVGRVLEPVHLLFQLVALGSDASELIALRIYARFGALRALGERA